MWDDERPVALVPLWQLEHVPVTPLWSNRAFVHVFVVWQSSQAFVEGIWVGGLPVARVPLWQLEQLPVTPEWSNEDVLQVPEVWHVSQSLLEGG